MSAPNNNSSRDPNWDLYLTLEEDNMWEALIAGRQDTPDSTPEFNAQPQPQAQIPTLAPSMPLAQPPTTTLAPLTSALRSQGEFFMTGIIPVPAQPEEGNCTVCMDELSEDVVQLVGCSHYFHTTCIHSWLTDIPTCPSCRRVLYAVACQPVPPHPNFTRTRFNAIARTDTPDPRQAPVNNISSVNGNIHDIIRNRSNLIAARRTAQPTPGSAVPSRAERIEQEIRALPDHQLQRAIHDVGDVLAEHRAAIAARPPQAQAIFDRFQLGTNNLHSPPGPNECLSPTATPRRSTQQAPTPESIMAARSPQVQAIFDRLQLSTDNLRSPPSPNEFLSPTATPGRGTPQARTPEFIMAARPRGRHTETPQEREDDSDFVHMIRRGRAEAANRLPATRVGPPEPAPSRRRHLRSEHATAIGRVNTLLNFSIMRDTGPAPPQPTATPRPASLDTIDSLTGRPYRLTSHVTDGRQRRGPSALQELHDLTVAPSLTEQARLDLIICAAVRLSPIHFQQFVDDLPLASAHATTPPFTPPQPSPSVQPSPTPRFRPTTTVPPFTAPYIPPSLLNRARTIAARTRQWYEPDFHGFPATERVVNEPGFASFDVSVRERVFRQAMAELEEMNSDDAEGSDDGEDETAESLMLEDRRVMLARRRQAER
jgi:hypothetical protein